MNHKKQWLQDQLSKSIDMMTGGPSNNRSKNVGFKKNLCRDIEQKIKRLESSRDSLKEQVCDIDDVVSGLKNIKSRILMWEG